MERMGYSARPQARRRAPVPARQADLPFTRESALRMLAWGAEPESSPYSHKEIVEWCDRFWFQYLRVNAPAEIEPLLPVLADVETQWDLYLNDHFSPSQRRENDCDTANMPRQWFAEWLEQVR